MTNEYIFVESKAEKISDIIGVGVNSDISFLSDKKLITIKGDIFFPNFVGELITPNNRYFSLPKNFVKTQENVSLIKKVLNKYRDIKGKDGKILLTNNSFSVSTDGKISSDKFYFNKLKESFLDYITYEFIYPKDKKKVHSTNPISGGKVDVFQTMRNRKHKGVGITYKTKDTINTNDWNIDDIYYSTIFNLSKLGTDEERIEIKEMKEFLESEGYIINHIKDQNDDSIISDINKCDVGVVHQSIKNTLLDYYESQKVSEKYSINAFYTERFEYVWEHFCQIALNHDNNFKNKIEWIEPNHKTSNPDIFSDTSGRIIIADSKYYYNLEKDFTKELYEYNECQNDKYPLVVLIPQDQTEYIDNLEHKLHELVMMKISLKDVISDVINKGNKCISDIHNILSQKSKRW